MHEKAGKIETVLASAKKAIATVDDTKDNDYFGIAIGFAVVVAAATVGGVSGGAFNPAVSMLSVVAGKSATIAVYWAGPRSAPF